MPERLRPITLQNVRLFGRNFSGLPTKYNPKGGVRRFCVILPEDKAEQMIEEGWLVKYLKPREEDENVPRPFIEVEVKFGQYPPRIVMIGSRGKVELNQTSCSLLDSEPALNVDLVLRPYQWVVNEKAGVKAYLKSIFYTIYEDELDLKYANVPDSATQARFDEEPYDEEPYDER